MKNKLTFLLALPFALLFLNNLSPESSSIEDMEVDLLINARAELMSGTKLPAPIRMFDQLASKSTQPYFLLDLCNFDIDFRYNTFGMEVAGLRYINCPINKNVKYDFRVLPSVYSVNYPYIGYESDVSPLYSFLDAGLALTFFNAVTIQADGAFGFELGGLRNRMSDTLSLGLDRVEVASDTSLPVSIDSKKLRTLHFLFQVRNPSSSGAISNSFFKSDRLSLKFEINTGNTDLINSAGSVLATGLTFLPFISYRYSPFLGEMFVGGSCELPPEWGWYVRPIGNIEIAVLHPLVRNASATLDVMPVFMGIAGLLFDPRNNSKMVEFLRTSRSGYSKMKSPDKYQDDEFFMSMIIGPTVFWGQGIDASNYSRLLPYEPASVLSSREGVSYGVDWQMLMIKEDLSMSFSMRVIVEPTTSFSVFYTAGGPKH